MFITFNPNIPAMREQPRQRKISKPGKKKILSSGFREMLEKALANR